MMISENGVKFITSFEGFSSKKYKDIAGYWTIGFGHKLLSGESFDNGVTSDEAYSLFKTDIEPVESTINSLVTADINQNQYDALCSFTYNLGCGALRHSHLLTYLNNNDFSSAAAQFLLWNHSGGKVVDGLTHRRQAEQDLFNS